MPGFDTDEEKIEYLRNGNINGQEIYETIVSLQEDRNKIEMLEIYAEEMFR